MKKKPKPPHPLLIFALIFAICAAVGIVSVQVYAWRHPEHKPPSITALSNACEDGFFPMRDEAGIHCFSGKKY